MPDGEPGDLRLFVAVPVGEGARTAVRDLVDCLAADPAHPEVGRLRWALSDNLHLTLRFLGPTSPDRLDALVAAATAAASGQPTFEARLSGAGAFPSASRPRIVWLGIETGVEGLRALAARLDDELEARGWPRDDRPFRAHLSVARADGVPGGGRAVEALASAATTLDAAWPVDRVVVYRSELGHGPARYHPVADARLGAATDAPG